MTSARTGVDSLALVLALLLAGCGGERRPTSPPVDGGGPPVDANLPLDGGTARDGSLDGGDPEWDLGTAPDLGPSCVMRAETCNDLDDDCDGIVDGPAAAASCAEPNALGACLDGRCERTACVDTFVDCTSAAGCETSTRSVDNCGGCGVRCALPNASSSCATGTCSVVACAAGFGDCDGLAANGCETSLRATANCGACGRGCALPNATATCRTGSCEVATCAPGYANCDASDANGCEAPLDAASTCGTCGVSCSSTSAAESVCTTAGCVASACAPGFADCDSNPSTVCETSLSLDTSCGACGNACGVAEVCRSNACVPLVVQPISAGDSFTCVVRKNGEAWCWGANTRGSAGRGAASGVFPPGRALSGAVGVASARYRSCAVLRSGGVSCWGESYSGSAPRTIAGVTNAIDVGVQEGSSGTPGTGCALRTDGAVVCWGNWDLISNGCAYRVPSGLFRQPGLERVTNVDADMFIEDGGHARRIQGACGGATVPNTVNRVSGAHGYQHWCATGTDGGVECWGYNGNGELGVPPTGGRQTPVAVNGMTGAVQVGTGNAFSCALRSNGTVACWGTNTVGQLGDRTLVTRDAPANVWGITDAVALGVGWNHACVLRATDAVSCWGGNVNGQCGFTIPSITCRGEACGEYTTTPRLVPGLPCGSTETYCAGSSACADLATSHDNCGSCGNACPTADTSCIAGTCTCAVAGLTSCGPGIGCVEIASDEANCGACRTPCAAGATCSSGSCACPGTQVACGGRCVDLASDTGNCGACGAACAGNQICGDSACVCSPATPDACGTMCVDQGSDEANCGACGNPCVTGATCVSGACGCPGAAPDVCSSLCVDRATDERNCGACGNSCPAGATCIDAACVCPGGTPDVCSSTCVDRATDEMNCGTCGNVCTAGSLCVSGTCVCAGATPDLCSSTCVDRATDEMNCGTCGNVCTTGSTCLGGSCVCSGPTPDLCSSTCVDRASDEMNCGTCGNLCLAASTCVSGACICAGLTPGICSSRCVDHASDNANCGTCGNVCSAGSTCAGGACICPGVTPGICSSRCVDLEGDETNCGACGSVCSSVCSAGTCTRVVGLTGSYAQTCALMEGSVQCWGGPSGDLPRFLFGSNVPFVDISIGLSYFCYVLGTGQAYCRGENYTGELGDGTSAAGPLHLVSLYSDFTSIQLSLSEYGPNTTCGTHVGGQVSCWGANDGGELGGGSVDGLGHRTPVRIPGVSSAVEVVLGRDHVCARRTDGSVSCWGSNSYGQLGRGAASSGAFAPANVSLPRAATRIFAGPHATCALLADRTLSCWGRNDYGALGDGTRTARGTPLVVPGLTGVVSASVGYHHVCAARTDGTVWCWGKGISGQLNPEVRADQLSATVGPDLTGAVEVYAGVQHSCARLLDSSVRCWGANLFGDLGDGTNTPRYVTVAPAF